MVTGIICKLRGGFRSIGLTAQWNESENCGNPALSHQVTRYLKMVQEQQAKAGVSQKQASGYFKFLSNQLQDFLHWLAVLLLMPECQDNILQFEIRMLRLCRVPFPRDLQKGVMTNLLDSHSENVPNP